MSTIEVKSLTKVFIRHKKQPGLANSIKGLFVREKVANRAVDDVSFSIEKGEIVGFLGPNGAGKTTVLKMLSGILYPTSGEAKVLGYTPWERKNEYKKKIGMVMGQKQQLIWDLPAADSFELFKAVYDIPDEVYHKHLNALVELLDVKDILNIQVRQLSLGQRMKLEIIAALLHKPTVLFLDEPTIGLDVVSQKNIRDFFKEYNKREQTTIILTSHYMQDVKELCERVIVINHGKIIYDDLLKKLIDEKVDTKILNISSANSDCGGFEKYGQILECAKGNIKIAVPAKEAVKITSKIIAELPVSDLTITEPEAEEVIRELFQAQAKSD